jgi:hypothetical protein
MQAEKIQIPNLETCQKLQELGLKPVETSYNFCLNTHPLHKEKPQFWLWDSNGECFVSDGIDILEAVFAPTADQLLPIVIELFNSGKYDHRISQQKKTELFALSEIMGKYTINLIAYLSVAYNSNLAQYLADIIIFLLHEIPDYPFANKKKSIF